MSVAGRSEIMDTRELIRITEGAIKCLLEENCESNIEIIKCLEGISYKLWEETNSDFLHSVCSASDDDDCWLWDESVMFTDSYREASAITPSTSEDEGTLVVSIENYLTTSVKRNLAAQFTSDCLKNNEEVRTITPAASEDEETYNVSIDNYLTTSLKRYLAVQFTSDYVQTDDEVRPIIPRTSEDEDAFIVSIDNYLTTSLKHNLGVQFMSDYIKNNDKVRTITPQTSEDEDAFTVSIENRVATSVRRKLAVQFTSDLVKNNYHSSTDSEPELDSGTGSLVHSVDASCARDQSDCSSGYLGSCEFEKSSNSLDLDDWVVIEHEVRQTTYEPDWMVISTRLDDRRSTRLGDRRSSRLGVKRSRKNTCSVSRDSGISSPDILSSSPTPIWSLKGLKLFGVCSPIKRASEC